MKKILILFALACLAVGSKAQANEEAAIKSLLEKESATWRSGDIQAHADCWAIKPYTRVLVSVGDSTVIDVPPSFILNPPADMVGKGGFAVNTNYKMNITGNNAWVSHDEESTDTAGKKTYSSEFRMLEKIDGQWKLVGQSIHIYKKK